MSEKSYLLTSYNRLWATCLHVAAGLRSCYRCCYYSAVVRTLPLIRREAQTLKHHVLLYVAGDTTPLS
ncbi:unnamed protein product [Ceratitis capitata]|uniref:(Mediterranean fruit fly) hypothetical protein n=1 Tax=Ceratitis capitata TaxID=7213 RepID=A0A811V5E3_CERCA|nr:unnamed protein product [Ceratitis capitata]